MAVKFGSTMELLTRDEEFELKDRGITTYHVIDFRSQELSDSQMDLITAARRKSIYELSVLLKDHIDLNFTDVSGWTVLHHLLARAKYFVLKSSHDIILCAVNLIEKMSVDTLNAQDKHKGRTALHYAVRMQDRDLAYKLLERGADPTIQSNVNMRTPAHKVATIGDIKLLEKMMDSDRNCVFIGDKNNETALHYAVEAGVFETAKAILDTAQEDNLDLNRYNFVKGKPGGNLLNYAVRGGSTELIDLLITKGVPINPSAPGISPLEEAVDRGHISVAQILLKGRNGERPKITPDLFIKIASKGYEKLARTILERDDWFVIMRGKTRKKTGYSCRVEYNTPFRELVRKLPGVAEKVLDKCILKGAHSDNPEHENHEIAYNFEFIDDFRDLGYQSVGVESEKFYSFESVQQNNRNWGPKHFSRSNHPLTIMMEKRREFLLNHPVTLALLDDRLKRSWANLAFNSFVYLIFLAFLTCYALIVPNPLTTNCTDANLSLFNESSGIINKICVENNPIQVNFIRMTAVIVLTTALCRLVLEIFQLIVIKRLEYFTELVNWVEIILYLNSIMFTAMADWTCPRVNAWQWRNGSVAVFLAWINLIFFSSTMPIVGIYVTMLIQICKTFIKLSILTILLITTFGLTFYMTFSDPSVTRSPFSGAFQSMVKTLSMTTGDISTNELFRLGFTNESNGLTELPNLNEAYVVWICFLILMPLLYANMLIGLAVGDTGKVLKDAEFKVLTRKIDQILSLEKFRLLPGFNIFYKKKEKGFLKFKPNKEVKTVKIFKPRSIYRATVHQEEEPDEQMKILTKTALVLGQIQEVSENLEKVQNQVKSNEVMLKTVLQEVFEMKQSLLKDK